MAGQQQTLESSEILLYTNRGRYAYDTLKIFDKNFYIKDKLNSVPCGDILASDIVISHYIVVKDTEVIESLQTNQAELEKEEWLDAFIWNRVAFDLDTEPETIISVNELIQRRLKVISKSSVNTYSFISVDTVFYSVPDELADKAAQ